MKCDGCGEELGAGEEAVRVQSIETGETDLDFEWRGGRVENYHPGCIQSNVSDVPAWRKWDIVESARGTEHLKRLGETACGRAIRGGRSPESRAEVRGVDCQVCRSAALR